MRTIRVLARCVATALLAACTPADSVGDSALLLPTLSFTVDGAGLEAASFEPAPGEVTHRWMFNPETKRTHVHVSGPASSESPWKVGIELAIPLSGPGTYTADTSHLGVDRSFSIALLNLDTRSRIALVGADAKLVLEPMTEESDWLTGTFSGRFAIGHRSTGRDILQIPPEDREYAEIRSGRFRARWQDTMHGKAERWPKPPDS